MAPLSTDAEAARERAQGLRLDARTLRLAVQQNLRVATQRKECAAVTAARAGRVVSVASPWSRLEWVRADEELSRVLVRVD